MSFYSPIDRLAQNLPRPKGTGSEFMTELSKMPGYKPQEAEDRGLQALMNLPKMERAQFLEALKNKPPVMPRTFDTRDAGRHHHKQYTLPGGTNYREIMLKHPQGKFEGVWNHFGGTPNILASVRAKDRKGPNGEKILHIEELQSDWHQKGREHGYRPPGQSGKLTGEPYQIGEDEYGIKWSDGSVDDSGYSERYANRLAEQGKLTEKVPDAPFKKNWHEMALKKMIHHAAANGYDSIAITPGREQADRYNLAKHIKALEYERSSDGKLYTLATIDPNGDRIHDETDIPISRVEQLVGKEIAKKIENGSGNNSGGYAVKSKDGVIHEAASLRDAKEFASVYPETTEIVPSGRQGAKVISGLDLHVGGEGMKGFYDKMIPSFLNQFGKKYGAKVGTINIKTPSHDVFANNGEIAAAMGYSWGDFVNNPDREQLEQQYWKNQRAKTTPVHHFPITPEMREDVVKNGVPLYADGGSVEGAEPSKTVKAYKLFRVHPKHPGKLFPLFVDANTPVEMGKWIDAKEGEMAKGKVKSKIGPLAYRPGWHAGDLPIATHIGEKSDPSLTAPDVRPENHAWAEVEMPDDVDWQAEATKRGTNAQGRVIPVKAHITDQIPKGGHYRYKTNPNMTGNWLIGGSMKVNRVLTDKEVAKINKAAGLADLPRVQPFKGKKFGFAGGGTVAPDEWKAEEHVNHMADGGPVPPLRPLNPQLAAMREQLAAQSALHKAYNEAMTYVNTNQMPTFKDWVASQGKAKGGSVGYPMAPKDEWYGEGTYEQEGGKLKNVSPAAYLAKVRPLTMDDMSRENIDLLKKHIQSGKTLDPLLIRASGKEDGRHRAHAAKELGIKTVPVIDYGNHFAKGGSIKPVGYTKEQVTVSPSLDSMKYELMSVKRYTKKVK